MSKTCLAERIKGAMYGVAVGDALGAPVEFMDQNEIKQLHGQLREMVGGGWLRLKPGEWTDDTEMTLAVAEGLVSDRENPITAIGEGFLRWRASNPPDIGMTTQAAFSLYDCYQDWFRAAEEVMKRYGKAAGNGALMRTIPVALVYTEPEEVYCYSMDVARMTHADPLAGLTCALYCLMAQRFLLGEGDRLQVLRHARQQMDALVEAGLRPAWETVDTHVVQPMLEDQPLDLKPSGFTVDSLLCALWAFLRHHSSEEAVVAAINLGGDTDTIGAICGGLSGAYWGYAHIPSRWLGALGLVQRERLDRVIESMAAEQGLISSRF